ncbi:MAG: pseudouridine synthase [Eubacteriales bacterium]|jgi:23S rRNA pseudouridine2604 synthase
MRINRYLSECGICSRREADRLVKAGHVSINGKIAGIGVSVEEGDTVTVDGRRVTPPETKTYLSFYKPKGMICTFDDNEPQSLGVFLKKYPKRVTYAGRLDRNSEGLMILTDDGEMIDRMMRARNGHEKEYEVTVDRPLTDSFLKSMAEGVWLEELHVRTRRCRVTATGERSFNIVLTQGLNRQIRRMCDALGYRVRSLKRIRVVNILLGDMKPCELRPLTASELAELRKTLEM